MNSVTWTGPARGPLLPAKSSCTINWSIGTAAEQFLSKNTDEIRNVATQTLEGHLRAILGTMTVEEIYQNRDAFAAKVQEDAAKSGKAEARSDLSALVGEGGSRPEAAAAVRTFATVAVRIPMKPARAE